LAAHDQAHAAAQQSGCRFGDLAALFVS
jgi:hypothetical protein